ncbi:MAG: hypothetical protein ACPGUD_05785 [Parashewanella sp.]
MKKITKKLLSGALMLGGLMASNVQADSLSFVPSSVRILNVVTGTFVHVAAPHQVGNCANSHTLGLSFDGSAREVAFTQSVVDAILFAKENNKEITIVYNPNVCENRAVRSVKIQGVNFYN